MIRIVGAAIVIFISFLFGEYFGLRYEFRKNQLSELRLGIGFLTGDLEFNLTPVYISAESIAERLREPVRSIFGDFSDRLKNGESIDRAWVRAITYSFEDTFFKAEDIQAVYPLGSILEGLDIEKQERGIRVLTGYIDGKIKELGLETAKMRRLYRSFSLLGGIFIVILLL